VIGAACGGTTQAPAMEPAPPPALPDVEDLEVTLDPLVVGGAAAPAPDRATPPEPGAADPSARYAARLVDLLPSRRDDAETCVATGRAAEPALAGTITVRIEVDRDGRVDGASADPPAGETGLAAVAACLEDRVRAWSLPPRQRRGVARVTLVFVLVADGPQAQVGGREPPSSDEPARRAWSATKRRASEMRRP
jgi:hypothetical protein